MDEFFNKLHDSPDWRTCDVVLNRIDKAAVLNSRITSDEVLLVLHKLGNNKAADPDGLIAEVFKYAVDQLVYDALKLSDAAKLSYKRLNHILAPHLTALFNHIMDTGDFPSQMTINDLAPLFKKGDISKMDNYRGITVCSLFSKVYSGVWEARLSHYVESNGLRSELQFGFRKGVGTMQNLFVLRHLIDKRRSPLCEGGRNRPLYVALIDLSKAFDVTPREWIWLRLQERGVMVQLWTLSKKCLKLSGSESS